MDPDDLDTEISSIRAEIRTLHHRRRILTSSLLSSRPLQRLSKTHSLPPPANQSHRQQEWTDISPLLQSSASHAQTNHHRIAFSTTTFPFTDPSPNAEGKSLLGIRIDICARDGRYMKPYYVLLRRVGRSQGGDGGGKKEVKVLRHTIPSVVDMARLERVYLPLESTAEDGEEEEQLKPWKRKSRNQDLKSFVREVRKGLVVWHLRCDAVRYLRETLGVVTRGVDDDALYEDDERPWERDILGPTANTDGAGETRIAKNKFGIVSLGPTSLEAVYVRLEWEDGRVGRFKISNTGVVERAVVIGDAGRDKLTEGILTGGDGRVETLLQRLEKSTVPASPEV
ncbi:uncharacterized protein BO80DRAFT_492069 [Aspergillus ibericus CBS 121593]|uniref:Cenp-O kinetochore centromere component n=1 Tax=Aspergillus ibericus CBS 121593 TaxID=1448316 RepID=A0A395H4E9_9EURO|nr:hypothetical protein BO80DRAFT_492069 [Aspergillus ibericus CBS 121593]RAL02801.1 hypothetical protein BO80DRAFT_492069 [Aspergillus ibericus CBS 121593]